MADHEVGPGRTPRTGPPSEPPDAAESDLQAGLRGVAGMVAGARGLVDLLNEVAQFAERAIPCADGAGVALLRPHNASPCVATPCVRVLAATADFVNEIDRAQYSELDEGPCLTCMQTGCVTVSGSLGSDARWPHFGGRVARMGVHSALSLPLTVGDTVIGAINTYARPRNAFDERAMALGSQFAGTAAVSVYNAQLLADAKERTERLQRALDSRAIIDQAIGILRSRSGSSSDGAFDRLRRMSQAENVKLAVVAERLVDETVRRAQARHQP